MEEALRSARDGELTDLLFRLRRRLSVPGAPGETVRQARELGLVEPETTPPSRLTPIGGMLSDSLTEYALWKQRGRRHHGSEAPALRLESLRGRRLLEVGCGACVNLLSLQRCTEVVGVDVEVVYLQFAEVLARIEGLPAPRRVCASAERLPFADETFDVALFPGSLQYMRIEQALREAVRVVRPGGLVLAVQSDLPQVLAIRARQRSWKLLSPGVFLREARDVAGMAMYPWAGRVLLAPCAPVHTTRRRMTRWLVEAGLRVDDRASCTVAHEVCYVAEKPARSGCGYRTVHIGMRGPPDGLDPLLD